MPKLEAYDKKLDYSYCLGIFPCHALLDARPEIALRLLLHPAGIGNEGVEKLRARCSALGIREEMAERVLDACKDSCELVLTGACAPDWITERADYLTEMNKWKHPFDLEVPARPGIEF